jgi:hypothetical protein
VGQGLGFGGQSLGFWGQGLGFGGQGLGIVGDLETVQARRFTTMHAPHTITVGG